jgi:glutathione S-transferase
MPILYSHHESGHCYKVALALTLMDVAFEQRPVDLNRLRVLRDEDFRNASLFGEVPVLVFDDGLAVCQSNAILDTLARRYGKLDGHTEAEKIRVREWLSWESNRMAMSLPHLRFSRRFTRVDPAVENWIAERMKVDMDTLQNHLQGARFLLPSGPTIADISICGYMFWANQARVELRDWPAVHDWLERIRALPGWRAPYDLLQARFPILTGTRT